MVWLDNSRIVAILAVILLHVAGFFVVSEPIGSTYWWIGSAYDAITRWCVPVFVMISGALLLDNSKQEALAVFYKKRMVRIFWPLVFWSVFYLAWIGLKNYKMGLPTSPLALAKTLLWGKPYEHLWFLYMILGLYAFTPFFRKVIVQSSFSEIKILAMAAFVVAAAHTIYKAVFVSGVEDLFVILFLYFIPYFFMGYLVRYTNFRGPISMMAAAFLIFVMATELGCYFWGAKSNLAAGLYFFDYLSVTVIPMSISMLFLLKAWQWPMLGKVLTARLSALTLGVYLIHPVMIDIVIYLVPNVLTANPLLTVPVMTIAVFVMSLLGTWVMSLLPYLRKTV